MAWKVQVNLDATKLDKSQAGNYRAIFTYEDGNREPFIIDRQVDMNSIDSFVVEASKLLNEDMQKISKEQEIATSIEEKLTLALNQALDSKV